LKVKQALDPYQSRFSIVHRIDPRIKLTLVLAYILTINLIPHAVWVVFPILISVNFSLAILSELRIGTLLKRSIWVFPFVLAAFPLMFALDGTPWFQVNVLGRTFTTSWQGFERVISIVFKAWVSIQAAIILVSTTKFEGILAGLRWLRVPKLLVAVIGLMWRYLFVLVDEAQRLMTARASRSSAVPGYKSGGKIAWRARVTGYLAGNLFLRSLERSERVYAAMVSRGYDGEVRSLGMSVLTRKEINILAVGLLFCFFLVTAGFYFGGKF
jgi:cobalt/nickel transport system permease protein